MGMGWGKGNGKGEVINPAAGDPVICGSNDVHPFDGKIVLIDITAVAHDHRRRSEHAVLERAWIVRRKLS